MRQCPVCGGITTAQPCGECGFTAGCTVFLNMEQLMFWQKTLLEPARQAERIWRDGSSAVFACGGRVTAYCEDGKLRAEPPMPYKKITRLTDVTAVAAGNAHIAVLLPDGTVRAAGRNHMSQCDTEEWMNIVQLCAFGDTTAGITSGGELVACGEGADDLEDIAAGLNERGLKIDSVVLNRSQVVLGAELPNGNTLVYYTPYREDDGSERPAEQVYPGKVQTAAGWAGCFVLHGGVIRALNTAAVSPYSAQLALNLTNLSAGQAERIAVGQETLYAYRRTGLLWYCNTARESGMIPMPEDAGGLLAVAEQQDGSLLIAVQTAGGIRTGCIKRE